MSCELWKYDLYFIGSSMAEKEREAQCTFKRNMIKPTCNSCSCLSIKLWTSSACLCFNNSISAAVFWAIILISLFSASSWPDCSSWICLLCSASFWFSLSFKSDIWRSESSWNFENLLVSPIFAWNCLYESFYFSKIINEIQL